ncbi:MAG: efflux RND transporter permease subunit, partial [Candidatus Thiodiazotropha weberae]|nr:efflux RND transporter permease subunit [Candidatus Thiodiazotropha lotti]MCW4210293.1 efflux RND transporter permease subunit [Candidatus Thiodiazotropha lotti]
QTVARACREVARPILFAITIVVIVFLPLFTLQGVEGKTFRPLAYTVALAMLGSLIFALIAAPVFSELLMRRRKSWQQQHTTQDDRRQRGEPIIVRTLLYFYQPLLHFFLRNRWFAVALSLILLLTGARVFTQLGMEFTPRLNEGDLIVNLTMAPSISLQETKRLTMIAERRMMQIPEVESVVSRIGRGEVGAHADPINTVHALVVLKPIEAWRPDIDQAAIEAELRHRLSGLPGILVNLTQPIQLTVDELVGGVKAELAVKLYGDDLQILKRYADEIAALLLTIPGAEDVQTEQLIGSPQLLIRPKREALARYGINLVDVQETIRAAIGGVTAGQVFDGVRRFDIYVRYQEEQRRTVEDVARLLVTAPTGERLPLGQLASIKTLVGPRQITRENNQRFATVQANIVGRDIGSFVAQAQRRIEQDIQLPPGYLISWGGQFELAQQANQRLALVVPITLGLIFLLLYMSFGSIRNSLLILLNIPLALVGGVISLWLLGENLSVPASVGFIALFGIALTNGMVLVTYLNQLVRQGLPIEEACKQGASQRLRPVLMTAITTALGLIPLLLASSTGSEVQRPLAAVVIGGLLTSTILTLLVAPAMYQWFALRTDKPRKLKGE